MENKVLSLIKTRMRKTGRRGLLFKCSVVFRKQVRQKTCRYMRQDLILPQTLFRMKKG